MNIEHLTLFVRLASTASISRAGHELGLSPAVASTHLGKLERDLGIRLFHRTTRKVSLTEDGRAFLPHAKEVLATVDAAKASVSLDEMGPRGTLRVSAPASFGRMHLMPGLSDLLGRYPLLEVDFDLTDSIVDLVEGGYDVAIRNSALKDSTLVARRLALDRRIVCAAPGYLSARGQPMSPEALNEHQCLNLTGLETWVFDGPAKPVAIRTEGQFRSNSGEAIRDACIAGMGLAVLSTWIAYAPLSRGELVPVLSDYPLSSDTAVWAVFPSSRLVPAKVRAFIDFYANRFGPTPYWDASI